MRLEVLAGLGRLVSASLDLDHLLAEVARAGARLTGVPAAGVYLVDQARGHLELRGSHWGGRVPRALRRLSIDRGLSGWVIRQGRRLLVQDVFADPRTLGAETWRAAGLTSYLGLPLVQADGTVRGLLTLGAPGPITLDLEDDAILDVLLVLAAQAVRNAELGVESEARRRRLEALATVGTRLGPGLDLPSVLNAIVEAAATVFEGEAGLRLLEGSEMVRVAATPAARQAMVRERIPAGEAVSGQVVATGRPVVIPDVRELPGPVPAGRVVREDLTAACLAVPVRVSTRAVGTLLIFRERGHRFDEDAQRLALTLADQAGIAVENARLYAESARGRATAEELARMTAGLTETLDVAEVGGRLATHVQAFFGARSAGVRLVLADGGLQQVATSGTGRLHPEPGDVIPPGYGVSGRVVAAGEPYATLDVLADPELQVTEPHRQRVVDSGCSAILGVPLRVKGRVIGALTIADARPRHYTADETSLLQTFADQAALAMDNARLFEAAEVGRREAEALARVARTLTESLDVAAVGERLVRSARELLGTRSASIRLARPDRSLVSIAWDGVARDHFAPGDVMPPGMGITGRAFARRQVCWTPDLLSEPDLGHTEDVRARIAAGGARATLAVPLIVRGEPIGVFTVSDGVGRPYGERDIRLAQAFADQAALALQNARLHEATEQGRREAVVLAGLARTINATLDLDGVLQRVVEGARDLCAGDLARIALFDAERDGFVFRYWVGAVYPHYDQVVVLPGKGLGGHVLQTGRPARTDDWRMDSRMDPAFLSVVDAEGIVAQLAVPIRIGGRIEGLLYVDRRTPRPFTDHDETLLSRLAEHAALATANARHYEAAERGRREAEVMADLARAINAALDVDSVLQRVAEAARDLIGDLGLVALRDPQTRDVVARYWTGSRLPREVLEGFVIEPGKGLGGLVLQTGQPLRTRSYADDPRFTKDYLDQIVAEGTIASIGVPIRIGEEVEGLIYVDRRAARPFTDGDEALLCRLAEHAAVGIRNARLYEEAERRRRQAETLAALARDIVAALDPDQVLQRVAEAAQDLCRAHLAHVALRTGDADEITVAFRFWAGHRRTGVQPFPIRPGQGLGGQVLLTGRPFRTDDYARDPRITNEFLPVIAAEGVKASMAVPISIDGRVEGLIFVDSRTHAFTERDQEVLEQVAGQAASAIRTARLLAGEQSARAAAEASGQRFRDLVQSLDAVVWEEDLLSGRNTFVSQRAESFLGRPVGDWATPGFRREQVHPEDRRRVEQAIEAALRLRDEFETEYRMLRADGRTVWVRDIVRVVRDGSGLAVRLRGLMVDVTEQKRAERRLAAQHAAARVLSGAGGPQVAVAGVLQAIGEGLEWDVVEFWRVDREADVLCREETWYPPDAPWAGFLNAGPERTFRRRRGLVGRAWSLGSPVWIPDVTRDPEFVDAAAAAAYGLQRAIAFPVRRGDDTLAVICALAREAGPPDGHVLAALTTIGSQVAQYLERTQAEEAVRESEARQAAIVQGALDAIISMDHEGKVTEFNPAAERLFGYRREDVVGQGLADLIIPPALRERHREGLQRYLAGGAPSVIGRRIELTALRRDGTEFACELSVTRVPGDGPPRFTGFLRDVTERRRLEEQLRQAQKMEAVGRLAGGVAHDFNNLLAVVMGHSELILGALADDDPVRDHAEEVRQAADRAATLTRQLLAFSRRQLLQPRVLDLNALITGVTRMLRRLIGEHIEVETDLAPGLYPVRADPGQIEQVVLNLAVNARDAMPQGGRLTLRTDNVGLDRAAGVSVGGAPPGPYVRLVVADTGSGMNPETLAHLFEPFFTTKGPGQGTGLGLSMVYGIVKQHHGYVAVESQPRSGTTFSIYLPRAEESADPAPEPAPARPSPPRGTETVLLVEDEPAVRLLVQRLLEQGGYGVVTASDGPEALERSRRLEGPIDLLVTDVVMPRMNGRELAERVVAERPGTRVLFISGYTDDALGPQGVLPAGTAFVQKPFTPDAFLWKVRDILDRDAGGPRRASA